MNSSMIRHEIVQLTATVGRRLGLAVSNFLEHYLSVEQNAMFDSRTQVLRSSETNTCILERRGKQG
jgi:hypothetical protein